MFCMTEDIVEQKNTKYTGEVAFCGAQLCGFGSYSLGFEQSFDFNDFQYLASGQQALSLELCGILNLVVSPVYGGFVRSLMAMFIKAKKQGKVLESWGRC